MPLTSKVSSWPTTMRVPLGKETRGTHAANATPSMLNASEALQPAE